jgi:rhamnulokinase
MPGRIHRQLARRGLPTLSTSAADAPALASLLFHSLAARYVEVLEQIEAVTGKQFRRLHIMGGGSQNKFLNRLTAQATGLDVVVAGTECSTTGNFAVQLVALEKTASPRPGAAWAHALQKSSEK